MGKKRKEGKGWKDKKRESRSGWDEREKWKN